MKPVYLILLLLMVSVAVSVAQVNPPRPVNLTTSTVQSLSFGIFSITGINGGSVTVSNTGIRTCTGDIFLSGNEHSYGIFTIECATGTILHMMNGPTATLHGNNGGQMTMMMGDFDPTFPFYTTTPSTVFQVGATLFVGSLQANPPGDYYGTYEIIINHQ